MIYTRWYFVTHKQILSNCNLCNIMQYHISWANRKPAHWSAYNWSWGTGCNNSRQADTSDDFSIMIMAQAVRQLNLILADGILAIFRVKGFKIHSYGQPQIASNCVSLWTSVMDESNANLAPCLENCESQGEYWCRSGEALLDIYHLFLTKL